MIQPLSCEAAGLLEAPPENLKIGEGRSKGGFPDPESRSNIGHTSRSIFRFLR